MMISATRILSQVAPPPPSAAPPASPPSPPPPQAARTSMAEVTPETVSALDLRVMVGTFHQRRCGWLRSRLGEQEQFVPVDAGAKGPDQVAPAAACSAWLAQAYDSWCD